jgi:hypothetical protein
LEQAFFVKSSKGINTWIQEREGIATDRKSKNPLHGIDKLTSGN